jgi:phenylacetate-CoA ligase
MGFMHAQWGRVGYNPACKKATFRGVPLRQVGNGCFWQHNPIHNELQFSPFHMHEATLGSYVQRLVEHGPEFIHGYPSAVDTLAEYVLRHELTARIPSIRAALLGSEACSKAQRDRIGAAFHTRVYTWYGHSERTILGGECECSEVYHAFPAYGVLEIVREDGTPCAVGEQGEIVGTGFLNRAMPFIRYRTDDYATRDSCECECGRTWDRFSNVVGRRSVEGLLIGKNGTRISDAALNMHGECFKNVIRYQYYQEVPGQLVIRIIPNPWYSTADEARIVAAHENKLWGEMEILVQSVEEIPLTASGKQRRILCEAVQLQGRPC